MPRSRSGGGRGREKGGGTQRREDVRDGLVVEVLGRLEEPVQGGTWVECPEMKQILGGACVSAWEAQTHDGQFRRHWDYVQVPRKPGRIFICDTLTQQEVWTTRLESRRPLGKRRIPVDPKKRGGGDGPVHVLFCVMLCKWDRCCRSLETWMMVSSCSNVSRTLTRGMPSRAVVWSRGGSDGNGAGPEP